MFGIDWGNPETLWLNVTNAVLGVVVLLAIAIPVTGTLFEVTRNRLAKRRMAAEIETELLGAGSHTFFDPRLGLTMADGGEPESSTAPEPRKRNAGSRKKMS